MTEAEWIAFLQRPEIPAFNRAMLAAPDDDLPRLVFADWLDENCPDARVGAVVRESMSGHPCTFHFLPVPAEVNVHADRGRLELQLEPNPPPPDEHGCRAMWESGWVGGLRLRDSWSATVGAWVNHPQMDGVEAVEVNNARAGVAEMIAAADHLTAMRHLDLSMCPLGADGVRALATANLPALRSLTLFDTGIGDNDVADLARSPTFGSLSHLDLASNRIGPVGAQALANSSHLTCLQSLRLSYNTIGDEGAATIAGSASFAGLQSLELELNEIGPNGVQALCDSGHLAGLTRLKLGANCIGDRGAEMFTGRFGQLQTVDLRACFDSPSGARAIARANLRSLRELDVSSNPIGDTGLEALVLSPLVSQLEKLNVGECGITVAGLRAIAAAPRFADPRPFDLWLTGNAFGENDEGVADELPPTLAAAVRNAIDWGIDRR